MFERGFQGVGSGAHGFHRRVTGVLGSVAGFLAGGARGFGGGPQTLLLLPDQFERLTMLLADLTRVLVKSPGIFGRMMAGLGRRRDGIVSHQSITLRSMARNDVVVCALVNTAGSTPHTRHQELAEPFGSNRRAEQVALCLRAVLGTQERELAVGFDAGCQHPMMEAFPEAAASSTWVPKASARQG